MKIKILFPLIILILTGIYQPIKAIKYETVKSGNWSQNNVWKSSTPPPLSWSFNDTIVIKHNINFSNNFTIYGIIIINSGAKLGSSNLNLEVAGLSTLINNGTLQLKNLSLAWNNTNLLNYNSVQVSNNLTSNVGVINNYGSTEVGNLLTNSYSSVFNNASNGIIEAKILHNYNSFTNAGSIEISDSLYNDWNRTFNNIGTIEVDGDFNNSGNFNSSGNIDITANFRNLGDFINSSQLNIGEDLINLGDFSNSSNIDVNGSLLNSWSSEFANNGLLNIDEDLNNMGDFSNTSNIDVNGSLSNAYSAEIENSGTLDVAANYYNDGTTTNNNVISIGQSLTNNWSSSIINIGQLSVFDNFSNNGNVTNDGNLEVDGIYSGNGDVTGSGSLCNSDGVTDPTGGAKSVSCEICGGDGSTLPVALLNFEASFDGSNVILNWATATETNNHFFELLRSIDGYNFESFKTITGNGNSNILIKYSAVDKIINTGTIYYQLKQVDFNGVSTLSKIVSINIENEFETNVFPNPATQNDYITINTGIEVPKDIIIIDFSGKVIRRFSEESSSIQLSIKGFSAGIYYLKILFYDNREVTQKFIIQ